MATATLVEVQAHLNSYVEQAQTEGPIIITRNGKAVAVIIAPLDDDDLESLILARSPRFQALLERSRKSLKAGKGLSSEQFWRTVNERKAEYKSK
ncbi:MAG TPA: type II toxin-antitoxin system Phd/YefM family antitoxin [Anaerolineales bacterium]|nr:type II toxin-antitoxin system Phd/YefM family antitoxin [Anaerolineales bacterium]